MQTRTNSVEEENTEIITTMAVNGQQEKPQNKVGGRTNETNNRRKKQWQLWRRKRRYK
jgi:hypothetical protein